MSRGPGCVQRAVLAVLAEECNGDGWLTVEELALAVAGPHPTRADVESVRRAMKQLAHKGRADVEHFDVEVVVRRARVLWGEGYVYRRGHHAYRPVLAAHWPLSVEEKERRAHSLRAFMDRLVALDGKIGGTP